MISQNCLQKYLDGIRLCFRDEDQKKSMHSNVVFMLYAVKRCLQTWFKSLTLLFASDSVMEDFNSMRLDNAQAWSQTESSLKRWSRDEELARFLSISKGVSRLHSAHTSHTTGCLRITVKSKTRMIRPLFHLKWFSPSLLDLILRDILISKLML